MEGIDHTRTKARHPQTNGICERFHRAVQDEFYTVAFQKKIHELPEQPQADVDAWISGHNTNRTHTGKYRYGRTSAQTFLESLPLAKENMPGNLSPAGVSNNPFPWNY